MGNVDNQIFVVPACGEMNPTDCRMSMSDVISVCIVQVVVLYLNPLLECAERIQFSSA